MPVTLPLVRTSRFLPLFALLGTALLLAACDSDITGTPFDNQQPDTELSVRDTSLLDNLGEDDRLTSTVSVSWIGSDADGYVAAFDVRFYNVAENPGPETGWTRTTRNDSLVLLPIPRGERIADVVFEVRAIDNEGAVDPTPARTAFPIQNAPPTIRLNTFETPPDTTYTVVSFAWTADDPEGLANLDRIEISLNDTLNFTALPADAEFVTLVAQTTGEEAPGTDVEARVFLGRSFQSTEIRVPGFQLDADNTFYVRSVDQTDTTSVREEYAWYAKLPQGDILFVNDYRTNNSPNIQAAHLGLLREYLPADTGIEVWDLSNPRVTGNTGNAPRSDALPPTADPTLTQTLLLFDHIYWVSSNSTVSPSRDNLPFAAGAINEFFEGGGTMMIHSLIAPPSDPDANVGNPAIVLLPLTGLITFPDTLRTNLLRVLPGAELTPQASLPGVSTPLPTLQSTATILTTQPYIADGASIVKLYGADFTAFKQNGQPVTWPGSSIVASMSADQRIGLFSLPLFDERNGNVQIIGADDDPDAGKAAIFLMLESLGFPKQ